MTATAVQISTVRRMCALAVGDTTYTDAILTAYIERYPLMDAYGIQWFVWDNSTYPPHQDANSDWVATYDLNAAAADVWDEKAATVSTKYDFDADGASMSMSQQFQQAQQRARYYRSRRAMGTIQQRVSPRPEDETLYGPEDL